MHFDLFFSLAGSRFELRLVDACRLAGINYQTACNKRNRGEFPIPVLKRGRNNAVVRIDDLYHYIYGVPPSPASVHQPVEKPAAVGRRGKPTKAEVEEAGALGLSVPQLRRRKAGLES